MGAKRQRDSFGRLADGRGVDVVTLTNDAGASLKVLTLGATVQALTIPDRHGRLSDVVLGYDDVAGYETNRDYFGVTLGRYANRIANAAFALDGRPIALSPNEGPNTLHGGALGFGRRLWRLVEDGPGVTLQWVSPDGEEGFPGELKVTARFDLTDDQVVIHYRATTSAPTVVSLSNHAYFNLAGEAGAEDILAHELTLPAAAFLPVDAASIPSGEVRPVSGTPFDFRVATPIGSRIHDPDPQLVHARGYDHTWVSSLESATSLREVARLRHPGSGRVLSVSSNQPGLQFYSGNSLDGTAVGKSGRPYRRHFGLSLEAQRCPDAPNQPQLGAARLAPGEVYDNWIIHRFSAGA